MAVHKDITERKLQELYDERAATERIITNLAEDINMIKLHLESVEHEINDMLTHDIQVFEAAMEISSDMFNSKTVTTV